MAYRLVTMVLVPTILGFLLAIGKAFAQLQSKDKTGRLVNLRRKAKCADGLSRETLNASRRDTVNVEVTADRVESAGTLLRASMSKTVWETVRRRLNSYLLGTVIDEVQESINDTDTASCWWIYASSCIKLV